MCVCVCVFFYEQIVDVSTGAILGTHQDGEICVRGPTVMKGIEAPTMGFSSTIVFDGLALD